MLRELPIELIKVIAIFDSDTWYKLYLYHDGFRALAKTQPLIKIYQNEFVEHSIDEDGDKCTYLFGQLHSINDQPAVIRADGGQEWYQNGQLHRYNDLPAAIY